MKHLFNIYIKVIKKKEVFNLPQGTAHILPISKKEDLYVPFHNYADIIDFEKEKAYIIFTDTKRYDKVEYLFDFIEREMGLKKAKLIVKSRNPRIVFARYLFCYGLKQLTQLGLKEIGSEIGLDHSTVIYGIKEFKKILEFDNTWRKEIAEKFNSEIELKKI